MLGKGPRGGRNSLRSSCGLGVVAIWHGAMRMTRTHATIVQIIIEGIANSEAERSGYIGIHGNTWTTDARGPRFESWTCQIIFCQILGRFYEN